MRHIKCCLDNECFTKKPQKDVLMKVRYRMASNEKELQLDELAKALESGQTFAPATFNGNRCTNASFKSQDVFALDFDDNITIYDFITKSKETGIMPSFIYKSFSHSEEVHKFRAIYLFEHTVFDIRLRNLIQITLMKLFPESDRLCKDASRQFWGTNKEVLMYDERNILTFEHLLLTLFNKFRQSSQTLRDSRSWMKLVGVGEYNKNPLILFDSSANLSKYENVFYSPKLDNHSVYHKYNSYTIVFDKIYDKEDFAFLDNKEKKVVDFTELNSSCELFSKSVTGEYWLYHSELFGIMSNLTKIKGGKEKLQKILGSRPEYSSKRTAVKDMYNQINKENYAPVRCENFCPFYKTCKNTGINMLHCVSKAKNTITQHTDINYRDINDIYKDMREDIANIMTKDDTGIFLVKAPTGSGKTSAVIDILSKSKDRVTLAFPTHKLKEEVYNKMIDNNISSLNVLRQPDIKDVELSNKIAYLNVIGASAAVQKVFRHILDDLDNVFKYGTDYHNMMKYINSIDLAKDSEKNVLMTHNRCLFCDTKHDTLIVDEDILIKNMIEHNTMKYSDFRMVFDKLEVQLYKEISIKTDYLSRNDSDDEAREELEEYKNVLSYLIQIHNDFDLKVKTAKTNKTYRISFDQDRLTHLSELLAKRYDSEEESFFYIESSNVLKFLRACYFTVDDNLNVSYVIKNDFISSYDKIIIMSATLNIKIYKEFFDIPIKVRDYGVAKLYDRVQITNKSFSRTTMKNKDIQTLSINLKNKYNKDSYTISYKKDGGDVYYGANEGLDFLKGLDTTIIGTPHIAASTYYLSYSAIYNKELEFHEMKYIKVRNDYYEFDLMSFEDLDLQNIQKYLVESEIEQAVGRSRDSREKCRVLVLSNYPTLGAKFMYLPHSEIKALKK